MSWRLVIADMLRRPGWLTVLLAVVFIAAAASAFAVNATRGLDGAIRTGIGRAGADLAVVPKGQGSAFRRLLVIGEPAPMSFPDPTAKVLAVEGVGEASGQLFVASAQADCCSAGDVLIIAVDSADDLVVKPWVQQGVLPSDASAAATGANLNRDLGLPITFYGTRLSVEGRLARTGWGYFDNAAFVTRQAIARMAEASESDPTIARLDIEPGTASVVWVTTERDPDVVAERIRSSVREADVVVLSAFLPGMRESTIALGRGLTMVAAAFTVVAVAAVALAFGLAVSRRCGDLAVLSAAGVSRRGLSAVVLVQAGMIGLLGGVIGGSAGGVLAGAFAQWMAITSNLPVLPPSPLQVVLSAVGGALAAAAVCALTAAGPALSAAVKGRADARG